MRKDLFCLLLCSFCALPQLKAQDIDLSAYQNPLQSGKRYQANIYVSTDLDTYCILDRQKIRPVSGTEHKETFTFRVLESADDSPRILFENHTNLTVVPLLNSHSGTTTGS